MTSTGHAEPSSYHLEDGFLNGDGIGFLREVLYG